MAIHSPIKKGGDFEIAPVGNHIARLYSVVHIGTIKEKNFYGEEADTDKVRLSFELPEEMRDIGGTMRPMIISQEYTNSMHEKANLGKIVRGMLGTEWHPNEDTESLDITQLVGKAGMLNIVHKVAKSSGKTRAEILSAAPLPKGIEAKPQVNPSFILDYDENWSTDKFEKLPDFLKQKIHGSREYREKILGEVVQDEAAGGDDAITYPDEEINPEDIPF